MPPPVLSTATRTRSRSPNEHAQAPLPVAQAHSLRRPPPAAKPAARIASPARQVATSRNIAVEALAVEQPLSTQLVQSIPRGESDVFQLCSIAHAVGAVAPWPLDPLYVLAGDHDRIVLRDVLTGNQAAIVFRRPPSANRTSPHGVVTAALCTALCPIESSSASGLLLWTGWSDGSVLLLKESEAEGTFFTVFENAPPEPKSQADLEDSCGISGASPVTQLLPIGEAHLAALYAGCGAVSVYHLLFDGPTVAIRHELVRIRKAVEAPAAQPGDGCEPEFVMCGATLVPSAPTPSPSSAPAALVVGLSRGSLAVVQPPPPSGGKQSVPSRVTMHCVERQQPLKPRSGDSSSEPGFPAVSSVAQSPFAEARLWVGWADGSVGAWDVTDSDDGSVDLSLHHQWRVHRSTVVRLLVQRGEVWSLDETGVVTKWRRDAHSNTGFAARQTSLSAVERPAGSNKAMSRSARVTAATYATTLRGDVVWVASRGLVRCWFVGLTDDDDVTEGADSSARVGGSGAAVVAEALRSELKRERERVAHLEADLQRAALDAERQHEELRGAADALRRAHKSRGEAERRVEELAAMVERLQHAAAQGTTTSVPEPVTGPTLSTAPTLSTPSPRAPPPYPGLASSAASPPQPAQPPQQPHVEAPPDWELQLATLSALVREKTQFAELLQRQIADMQTHHSEQTTAQQKAMRLLEARLKQARDAATAASAPPATAASSSSVESSSQTTTPPRKAPSPQPTSPATAAKKTPAAKRVSSPASTSPSKAASAAAPRRASPPSAAVEKPSADAAELRVQVAHRDAAIESLRAELKAAERTIDALMSEKAAALADAAQAGEAREAAEGAAAAAQLLLDELTREVEAQRRERAADVAAVEAAAKERIARALEGAEARMRQATEQCDAVIAELRDQLAASQRKEAELSGVVASVLQSQRERMNTNSPRVGSAAAASSPRSPTPRSAATTTNQQQSAVFASGASAQGLWWQMHHDRVAIELRELQHRVGLQRLWAILAVEVAERRVKAQWVADLAARDEYITTMRHVVGAFRSSMAASSASALRRGGAPPTNNSGSDERDELLRVIMVLQDQSDRWYYEATLKSRSPSQDHHHHHHHAGSGSPSQSSLSPNALARFEAELRANGGNLDQHSRLSDGRWVEDTQDDGRSW